MAESSKSPAQYALELVRSHLKEVGADIGELSQKLNLDLMDSGKDSAVAGAGIDFRMEVLAALEAAGYEVVNR